MTQIDTVFEPGATDTRVSNLAVSIEALADGGYVTVWTNRSAGLVIQRFDANGLPIGDEFNFGSNSNRPNVAALDDGGFIVTYHQSGIQVARFDAQGNLTFSAPPMGSAFTTLPFDDPEVIALDDGGYVIIYTQVSSSLGSAVIQQRFDANNNAVGAAETLVSTDSRVPIAVEATETSDGGYIVSYIDGFTDLTATVRFDANGQEIGRIDGIGAREEVLELPNGNIVLIDNSSSTRTTSFQILDDNLNIIASQSASSFSGTRATFVNGAGVALEDGSFIVFEFSSTDDSFFGTFNSVNGIRYASDGTLLGSISIQIPPFDDATSQLRSTDVGVDAILLPNGNLEVIYFQNDQIFTQVIPSEDLPIDGQRLTIGTGSVIDIDENGGQQIIGTLGEDNLIGAAGNDVLRGSDGDDIVSGLAGDDTIAGNGGDDELTGGDGNDQFFGGSGRDTIFGGDGDDTIEGGADQDQIDAGAGNDFITSTGGNDFIIAGSGDDTIVSTSDFSNNAPAFIDPGEGNDLITLNGEQRHFIDFSGAGNAGNDTIEGFSGGFDSIRITGIGTPLSDLVFTQIGADTLVTTPNGDSILFRDPVVPPTIDDFVFVGEEDRARVSGETELIDTTFLSNVGDTEVDFFSVDINALAGGGFVTIISNDFDPLVAQRFDADGNPIGTELSFGRGAPEVATFSDGGFIVVGSPGRIDVDRFDAEGNLVFSVDDLNDPSRPGSADVVTFDDGSFVIIYQDRPSRFGDFRLLQQRFDANSNPIGGPEVIATEDNGFNFVVGNAADGNYLISFRNGFSDPAVNILLDQNGNELQRASGQIRDFTEIFLPSEIVPLSNGNLLLVGVNSARQVVVEILDANLSLVSQQIVPQLATFSINTSDFPTAVLEDDSFIIINSVTGAGQRFLADGSLQGPTFFIERPPFEPGTQQLDQNDRSFDVTVQENGSIEVVFFQNERVFVQTLNIEDLPTGGRIQIFGDDFDNDLTGDDFSEQLFGRDGNDTLNGGLGDDTLSGGVGADVFVIGANAGNDTILDFNPAEDILDIGEIGATFTDLTIVAEGNNTRITGPNGLNVVLLGVSPSDLTETVFDFGFDSEVVGGTGDDTIPGTPGRDNNDGGGGNDVVGGGADNDSVVGGAGDDTLLPGTGSDTVDGGDGNDTVDFGDVPPDPTGGGVDVDLGGGTGMGADGDDVINNVENTLGTEGDDTLTGDEGNNLLDGRGGDDTINGAGGNDTLIGGAGDDTLTGGAGNDSQDGGAGNDILNGDAGNDNQSGGTGNDILNGGAGNDRQDGGAGDDVINGNGGDDTLDGNTGDDVLTGGDGDDLLDGGPGNDTLDGQAGNDTLIGGSGNDLLTGGTGMDTFVFGNDAGSDVITDFEPDVDIIDLSGFGPIGVPDLDIAQDGPNVIITLPNGATVTVNNTNVGDFTDASFTFGNPTDEIPVNTFTDGIQGDPAIAAFGNDAAAAVAGGHIVVYESDGQDGSFFGVFARLFNSDGAPVGVEFQINLNNTNGNQFNPDVAVLNDGTFVVTWVDANANRLLAQRFEVDGTIANPIGEEIIVDGIAFLQHNLPISVVATPNGGFAISYTDNGLGLPGGGSASVPFLAIYDANGQPTTPNGERVVAGGGAAEANGIAVLANGNLITSSQGNQNNVVIRDGITGQPVGGQSNFNPQTLNITYVGLDDGGYSTIFLIGNTLAGRTFASDGSRVSLQFDVATDVISGQDLQLEQLSDGTLVAIYSQSNGDENGAGVIAQRLTTQGQLIGDPLVVNQTVDGNQFAGRVALNANGDLVVTYSSDGEVFVRTLNFVEPVDPTVSDVPPPSVENPFEEHQVNTFTDSLQNEAAIATFANDISIPSAIRGGHVVVFESNGQDGSGLGVYAQLFGSDGQPVGFEFQIDDAIVGNQQNPDVIALDDGSFLVSWITALGTTLLVQRFEYVGSEVVAVGSPISVDTLPTLSDPTLIELQSGGFAVRYLDTTERPGASGPRAFVSTFDAMDNLIGRFEISAGALLGSGNDRLIELSNGNILFIAGGGNSAPVFNLVSVTGELLGAGNPTGVTRSDFVTAAALDDGGYIVAFLNGSTLLARTFDENATPTSPQFVIATSGLSAVNDISIDQLSDGILVVTYTTTLADSNGTGVFTQRLTTQGQPIGDPVLVNNGSIIGNQILNDAEVNAAGDLVVTFSSNGEVFARTIDLDAIDPVVIDTGSSADDSLTGGNADDDLSGGAGDDVLIGGSGRDTLDGGSGVDTLIGGFGADVISDSAVGSVIDAGPGDDTIFIGFGTHDITGGDGFDQIIVNTNRLRLSADLAQENGIEVIDGSSHASFDIEGTSSGDTLDFSRTEIIGNALIEGLAGNDTIIGTSGDDNIDAGTGADSVFGGAGDDTIVGGPFNASDTLNGGEGDDLLSAGSAADRFVFDANSGNDTITDFEVNLDRIDLTSLSLTFNDLTIAQVGDDAVVTLSLGNTITLTGVDANTVDQNDFLF